MSSMNLPKKFQSELGMGLLTVLLLGLLIQPSWMPMGIVLICLGLLAASVFGLGVFIWRESPKDEREYLLISQSGRTAYLMAGAVMTLGVAVQTLQHKIDIWLLGALASMILIKIIISARQK